MNSAFQYRDGSLYADGVSLEAVAAGVGTPAYVYSLPRVLDNLRRIQAAFAPLNAHVHYSAKANGNLAVLRALVAAGAGIDAVSGGEIYRALAAGCAPEAIVFAGVGKTADDLAYALEQGVGWFNVENADEVRLLDRLAGERGRGARVALRLNPDVAANTHRHIATGHGGAKFGMPAETIQALLAEQARYPHLRFEGVHVHIGSQLHDTEATTAAAAVAVALITPYATIRTVNIGGGLPAVYSPDERLPTPDAFAAALAPILGGYEVLIEPGRSIIADAGVLLTRVLYRKEQGGTRLVIVDAGMTELIRPMLYEAAHTLVSVVEPTGQGVGERVTVVGPVCESTDVLARDVALDVQPGDLVAVLTAGAYGMVMASQYNARLRPPEVVIEVDGRGWRVARRRETYADLVATEVGL